jgi:hypothetical protein
MILKHQVIIEKEDTMLLILIINYIHQKVNLFFYLIQKFCIKSDSYLRECDDTQLTYYLNLNIKVSNITR